MAMMQPIEQPKRSMIYRLLLEHGAEFEPYEDAAIAMRYSGNDAEIDDAKTMGIADLSPLPRVGFKGKDTPGWLTQQGVLIPQLPNQARRQTDNSLVLRLSNDEHVVLGDLTLKSTRTGTLLRQWQLEPGRMCYLVPRNDTNSWFCLSGRHTPEMLAKVCGVDMRLHKFSDGQIAQTSIARINGIVVRNDLGKLPAFYILVDSASADFLWPCLVDAMDEYSGSPVGLTALQTIENT